MYTFLNVKNIFLAAVVLFEIGSAICGAAPNSTTFIIGRAIAGLGAGGIQSGVVGFYLFNELQHTLLAPVDFHSATLVLSSVC